MHCLDSVPMLLALVMLNTIHPGDVMPGKESEFPSSKSSKEADQREISTAGSEDVEKGVTKLELTNSRLERQTRS